MITSAMPFENAYVQAIIIMQVVSVFVTFQLFMFPVYIIIEDTLKKSEMFVKMDNSAKEIFKKESHKKTYKIYSSIRLSLVIFTIVCGIFLAKELDKFVSVLGSFLCAPMTLLTPCVIHYKTMAFSSKEKQVDMALMVVAVVIMIMSTYISISAW
jgi:proton-coupled amino acid transporter